VQAQTFAKRVGYLPLALDLGASQVEDGLSWEELLEDLQAEVARLETLDVYGQEEMPDDTKRRRYSLLACFNLSLKRLSSEQLQQFAWLGVVPEDVSLTQEMAQTLWQVSTRQAGDVLRTFRRKALVLQGAKQANERYSYRMHDLMHDLAYRLLVSSPQPARDCELPGLGLTKSEAHRELLARYQANTQQGQWHTLKDDGYIYAHLTWHMEQAEQSEAIHQLLKASNEHGRNAWYEACDVIGKSVGFVNDMSRAWHLTIRGYQKAPEKSMVRLFRYSFIRASLNSMAKNVSAELLKALVNKNVWQPVQALAYVQHIQEPWQRAECVSSVIPCLPEALLLETLKIMALPDLPW
jgi:hypothetical protein